MTSGNVFQRLRPMIAESLAVDESNVTLESRLIDDLGADSLDFVDLVFAIERTFGVKLRETDLTFLARLDFSSPTVMKDGYLTREAVEAIAPFMPALQQAADRDRVAPKALFSLFTVETLCLMIERRLSADPVL